MENLRLVIFWLVALCNAIYATCSAHVSLGLSTLFETRPAQALASVLYLARGTRGAKVEAAGTVNVAAALKELWRSCAEGSLQWYRPRHGGKWLCGVGLLLQRPGCLAATLNPFCGSRTALPAKCTPGTTHMLDE